MIRSALIAVLFTLSLAACGEKTAQTAPVEPVAAPALATEQAPAAPAPDAGTETAPAAPAPAK